MAVTVTYTDEQAQAQMEVNMRSVGIPWTVTNPLITVLGQAIQLERQRVMLRTVGTATGAGTLSGVGQIGQQQEKQRQVDDEPTPRAQELTMSRPNKRKDVWAHINMHGGDTSVCWEWLLAPGGAKGRGKQRAYFTIGGKKLVAQRIIHEDVHGVTLSPTELIRHTCDNGLCCNYTHWVIGTHQENMDDMVGRDRHGLPSHVVRRIRVLLMRGDKTHAEIADLYAVDRSVVTRIANDDAHTHPNDYPTQEEMGT